jgi:hypothetical protein
MHINIMGINYGHDTHCTVCPASAPLLNPRRAAATAASTIHRPCMLHPLALHHPLAADQLSALPLLRQSSHEHVVQMSNFVVLSADRQSVRPNFSMQRTVLILRNIAAETPPNEVYAQSSPSYTGRKWQLRGR